MKKTFQVLTTLIILSMTLHAEDHTYQAAQKLKSINQGQRIFRKKLQRKCGFTASYWAQQHTKKEWESFQNKAAFIEEFTNMCPRGVKVVKDKWRKPLYLFATEYAKDTGNRPRC